MLGHKPRALRSSGSPCLFHSVAGRPRRFRSGQKTGHDTADTTLACRPRPTRTRTVPRSRSAPSTLWRLAESLHQCSRTLQRMSHPGARTLCRRVLPLTEKVHTTRSRRCSTAVGRNPCRSNMSEGRHPPANTQHRVGPRTEMRRRSEPSKLGGTRLCRTCRGTQRPVPRTHPDSRCRRQCSSRVPVLRHHTCRQSPGGIPKELRNLQRVHMRFRRTLQAYDGHPHRKRSITNRARGGSRDRHE